MLVKEFSPVIMSRFSNSPSVSTDSDEKMNKRMRSHYRKLARELYGTKGLKAVSVCETEHEVSRVLHDLRTAAF
jgi:hypothetical protein